LPPPPPPPELPNPPLHPRQNEPTEIAVISARAAAARERRFLPHAVNSPSKPGRSKASAGALPGAEERRKAAVVAAVVVIVRLAPVLELTKEQIAPAGSPVHV